MTEELRIEMTWTRAVPLLLEIYTNATPKGRAEAREELMRLARIGDAAVTGRKELADLLSRAAAFCEDVDSLDHEDRMSLVEDLLAREEILRPTTSVATDDPSTEQPAD